MEPNEHRKYLVVPGYINTYHLGQVITILGDRWIVVGIDYDQECLWLDPYAETLPGPVRPIKPELTDEEKAERIALLESISG